MPCLPCCAGSKMESAIRHGNEPAVRRLLQAGYDANRRLSAPLDSTTTCCLYLCCIVMTPFFGFIIWLVSMNDRKKFFPLQTAVYHEQVAIVKLLLESGALPNNFRDRPRDSSFPPLLMAAASGTDQAVQIFQMLVAVGRVDLNTSFTLSHIGLKIAKNVSHTQYSEKLLPGSVVDGNVRDNSPRSISLLNLACSLSREKIVNCLINMGVNVNAGNPLPLSTAVKAGSAAAVQLLVQAGADPRSIQDGKTILDLAREKGDFQILQLLTTPIAINQITPQLQWEKINVLLIKTMQYFLTGITMQPDQKEALKQLIYRGLTASEIAPRIIFSEDTQLLVVQDQLAREIATSLRSSPDQSPNTLLVLIDFSIKKIWAAFINAQEGREHQLQAGIFGAARLQAQRQEHEIEMAEQRANAGGENGLRAAGLGVNILRMIPGVP